MRLVLDENLPLHLRDEIKVNYGERPILDVNEEYKGILDLELVNKMEKEDILVTGDRELHRNMVKIGARSIYYDVQTDNLVEVQVKIRYHLKGYSTADVERTLEENENTLKGPNAILRKRIEELKDENSSLKVRLNVLEGKLRSVLLTAESAFDD